MFRKGHRLFSVASIGLILAAVMHAIGHFSSPPDDLVVTALFAAMQSYRFDLGLGTPSMMDIYESLNLNMAIMLLWTGIMNLLVARYAGIRDKLMRRVCTLNVVAVGSLAILFASYQVSPPAVAMTVVWILFVVTRFRLRRSRIIRQVTQASSIASSSEVR